MSYKPIVLFGLCLVNSVVVLETQSDDLCNVNFKVEHNLYNDGFHRNLSFVINFSSFNGDEWNWVNDGACSVAVEQTLPAGVYASPDEVKNYYNDYFHAVLFKNPVDIELPANDATPITMQFFLNAIHNKILFSLPIHARYHPAIAGGGAARNVISSPKIYLNCQDKRFNKCEKINKGISSINNLCSKDVSPEKCAWKEIPITVVTEQLIWDVPVGNTDHFYMVAFGTAVVVIFWSIYLLKIIHNFKIDSMTKISDKIK